MDQGFPQEIQLKIYEAQRGFCIIVDCVEPIHSTHHKLHNTKLNRKRFPLFIDSPMNGVGLCYKCHRDKNHLFKITFMEAIVYENWLQGLKNGR